VSEIEIVLPETASSSIKYFVTPAVSQMLATKLVITCAVLFATTSVTLPVVFASGLGNSSGVAPSHFNNTDSTISVGSGQGVIVYHAHRIQSPNWAPCFASVCDNGTGPGLGMYFVVYNSSRVLIAHGYADENGTQITGLNLGQNYSIYPADCDMCHNSTHSVIFVHWGGKDNSTDRPRTFVLAGGSSAISLDVYYKLVEMGTNSNNNNPQTSSNNTNNLTEGTNSSLGPAEASTTTNAISRSNSLLQ
jgi:hypothetical protein